MAASASAGGHGAGYGVWIRARAGAGAGFRVAACRLAVRARGWLQRPYPAGTRGPARALAGPAVSSSRLKPPGLELHAGADRAGGDGDPEPPAGIQTAGQRDEFAAISLDRHRWANDWGTEQNAVLPSAKAIYGSIGVTWTSSAAGACPISTRINTALSPTVPDSADRAAACLCSTDRSTSQHVSPRASR